MADIVSRETRSRMMAGISSKDTKPEMIIRRGLHVLGFRYRLHQPNLPGKPDIVLRRYNAILLVNGCFWHGHDCSLFRWPKSRPDYWRHKIDANRNRDRSNHDKLGTLGWRQLKVWECSIKGSRRRSTEEVVSMCEAWLVSSAKIRDIREL